MKNSKGALHVGRPQLNELAPRDIVARAIVKELERSGRTMFLWI